MSGTPPERDRRATAAFEAAEWAARFGEGQPTAAEREAFVNWLLESPVHVSEMLRLRRMEGALGSFQGWPEPKAAPLPDNVVEMPLDSAARYVAPARPARRGRAAVAAAAAIFVAAAGAVGLFAMRGADPARHLQTRVAERLEVTLEDGSVVRLSPETVLDVRFSARQRSLHLLRGEAVCMVAKDKSRPFVVESSRARVIAVGTVFSVATVADSVVVTVAEGRVNVEPLAVGAATGAGPIVPIVLAAHQRLALPANGGAPDIRAVDTEPARAWEGDSLVFEGIPVADVVARFNGRPGNTKLRVEDPALAGRRVSGVFDPRDPKSFADFLVAVAGAQVTQMPSGDLVVAPSGAAHPAPAR